MSDSTTQHIMQNGVMVEMNAAQVKAVSPANSVYTFSQPYPFHWQGTLQVFRTGKPYVLDAALKAALLAASAPMTAA